MRKQIANRSNEIGDLNVIYIHIKIGTIMSDTYKYRLMVQKKKDFQHILILVPSISNHIIVL